MEFVSLHTLTLILASQSLEKEEEKEAAGEEASRDYTWTKIENWRSKGHATSDAKGVLIWHCFFRIHWN